MLNRIVLVGRLVADPESSYTTNGIEVAKFRIAVDRTTKNQETGEKETDFINVVAWRRTAEFVTRYLTKGRLVAVEGRLQIRGWVQQDGQKRTAAEVVADNVQGLDRPRDAEGGPGPARSEDGTYAAAQTPAPRAAAPVPPPGADADEPDPFADE
jgi:single-strand DNA-binding protein